MVDVQANAIREVELFAPRIEQSRLAKMCPSLAILFRVDGNDTYESPKLKFEVAGPMWSSF